MEAHLFAINLTDELRFSSQSCRSSWARLTSLHLQLRALEADFRTTNLMDESFSFEATAVEAHSFIKNPLDELRLLT